MFKNMAGQNRSILETSFEWPFARGLIVSCKCLLAGKIFSLELLSKQDAILIFTRYHAWYNFFGLAFL